MGVPFFVQALWQPHHGLVKLRLDYETSCVSIRVSLELRHPSLL